MNVVSYDKKKNMAKSNKSKEKCSERTSSEHLGATDVRSWRQLFSFDSFFLFLFRWLLPHFRQSDDSHGHLGSSTTTTTTTRPSQAASYHRGAEEKTQSACLSRWMDHRQWSTGPFVLIKFPRFWSLNTCIILYLSARYAHTAIVLSCREKKPCPCPCVCTIFIITVPVWQRDGSHHTRATLRGFTILFGEITNNEKEKQFHFFWLFLSDR